MNENRHPVTLTLYPNNVGLAYVISEGLVDILEDGIQKISPISTRAFLKHTKRFFEYAKPDIVVLRNEQGDKTKMSKRTKNVVEEIKKMAHEENLKVFQYNRTQIKELFIQFGASNKYGVARKLITFYDHLKPKMPHYRSFTKSEHYQMGLFDAFALMMTHFYLKD